MNTVEIKKNTNTVLEKGKRVVKRTIKKIEAKINEAKENSEHNYYNYIEYYGDYTFQEREFNEIDNVILSMIIYIDFSEILSNTKEKKSLAEITKEFHEKYTKEEIETFFATDQEGARLLRKLCTKRRYKDIKMFNYSSNRNSNSQFSAVTFDLGNNYYFIAFEGTDELISGWEEDFRMSYSFPVEAHVLAKKYINKFTISNAKLILGGHSKGGNLALVSAMYANLFVKMRIKKIYSNDGPGLRKDQIESKRYKKLEKKYVHIIPNSSIVGLFLRHTKEDKVIKSSMPGFISHAPSTWQINYNTFERAKLSRFSKVFDEGFSKWLSKYSDEERELFTKGFFDILRENKIDTLLQFRDNYKLITNVIKTSKNIDPKIKDMTKDLVKVISKTNLEYPLFK